MAKVIAGVGPDAPIETLPGGGRQSVAPARLELIDPHAIFALGKVLMQGREKYGEDIPGKELWKLIPTRSHLNKALIHIYAWVAGDRSDEHLEHAFCRLMMAIACEHSQRFEAEDTKYPGDK